MEGGDGSTHTGFVTPSRTFNTFALSFLIREGVIVPISKG